MCCLRLHGDTRNASRSLPVELYFSTYEEVGHGGAPAYPTSVRDVLVIDMGVVGDRLSGSEQLCSICAKDSGGPYDYRFRTSLVEIAERKSIPHAIDVYPFYSSDGTALWRAGGDVRVALIGPECMLLMVWREPTLRVSRLLLTCVKCLLTNTTLSSNKLSVLSAGCRSAHYDVGSNWKMSYIDQLWIRHTECSSTREIVQINLFGRYRLHDVKECSSESNNLLVLV